MDSATDNAAASQRDPSTRDGAVGNSSVPFLPRLDLGLSASQGSVEQLGSTLTGGPKTKMTQDQLVTVRLSE